VYLPSGQLVGVVVSRPQDLVRPTRATQQDEQVVAVLDKPQTGESSSHENSHAPQGSGSMFSFSGHDSFNASGPAHKHESASDRGDSLSTTRRTKPPKGTEERTKSELAIDGTGLLDPRKADPAMFNPSGIEEGRMRTRRSKSTRGDSGDGTGDAATSSATAVSVRKDSKTMDGLEVGSGAFVKDASRTSMDQQDDINARTSLADRAGLIMTPNATLAATPYAAATASEIVNNHVIAVDEERDQASVSSSKDDARLLTTMTTQSKSAKRKSRFEKELETDGTPFLQRSNLTDANSLIKEYYDGKRWYQVIGSEKPDWATAERTVDRRSKL
jgi:hypothetical protein